jgi:hypothetical protein
MILRASSDDTDARHSQAAQGTDRVHPQAGSCQTAKDKAITPFEGRSGDLLPFWAGSRQTSDLGRRSGPTKERRNELIPLPNRPDGGIVSFLR